MPQGNQMIANTTNLFVSSKQVARAESSVTFCLKNDDASNIRNQKKTKKKKNR